MTLREYFVDLHVHIGYTMDGYPVKVTAARHQTIPAVCAGALQRKGLDLLGIVDAVCPRLCSELEQLVECGEAREMTQGGLRYREGLTVIPGAEMEACEDDGAHAHWLAYFPALPQLRSFSGWLSTHLTNPELSTQVCRLPARRLLPEVLSRDGIFFPAHAFTPHKGVYGACTDSLSTLLGESNFMQIPALELGLSADTGMADCFAELSGVAYLSNSDAHSIKNLGREYNKLMMAEPNWSELVLAIRGRQGRRVAANYGLDPRLGKYHRTFCLSCERIATGEPPVLTCPSCGSPHVVKGVLDRIREISDFNEPHGPEGRPTYIYQVPLLFLPGVGEVTVKRLLETFGTEMNVLHRASREELIRVVGEKLGDEVCQARDGRVKITAGGGGIYGKVSCAWNPVEQ